ncbi:hypothetical protein [Litchfieldia alkalitelluris]|uniref:hypothetical protein n=1 Tax=Litchfieldia alkalitelluris TaxID=304268 RepID=UPI000997AD00|nr:hypothetical protein [Litchfieldia alkalitelluris]
MDVLGFTKYTDPDWDGPVYVATHNRRHVNKYFSLVYERLNNILKDNIGEPEDVIIESLEKGLHQIRTQLLKGDILLLQGKVATTSIAFKLDHIIQLAAYFCRRGV